MPRFDVVCFGEVLWDLFEAGPRGREPIGRIFRRELGGASANAATALARLGLHVALAGTVGSDRLGQALRDHLARDGVDLRFVRRLPARTGVTMVVRDARGQPSFLPYRAGTADGALRREQVTPAMGRARWLLLGTSALLARAHAQPVERLLDFADHAGARVAVDLNLRPHAWSDRRAMSRAAAALAGRAALIKASAADLLALGPPSAPFRWLERHAPGASWLITRGSGVASAIGEHGEISVGAPRRPCVDATGAGDAFLAGSLATLLAARAAPSTQAWGDPAVWRAALRVGHILGTKAVSRRGAVAGLSRLGRARALLERIRKEHCP